MLNVITHSFYNRWFDPNCHSYLLWPDIWCMDLYSTHVLNIQISQDLSLMHQNLHERDVTNVYHIRDIKTLTNACCLFTQWAVTFNFLLSLLVVDWSHSACLWYQIRCKTQHHGTDIQPYFRNIINLCKTRMHGSVVQQQSMACRT